MILVPFGPHSRIYGGIDLSSTTDVTAWCMVERMEPGYRCNWRFFIPKERAQAIEQYDRIPYKTWHRQGFIEFTPGHSIDYETIEKRIAEDCDTYNMRYVGYDPWAAEALRQRLEQHHNVNMVKVSQGMAALSAPSKMLEACVFNHTLEHGDNPIANWMASNVEKKTDDAGNIKPIRPKRHESRLKIDGIVALILAIAVASVDEERSHSVYDEPGQLLL